MWLGANQAKFTQLTLYLVTSCSFTCKQDNILRSPAAAFRVNQQVIQCLCVGLSEWQRNKMGGMIVIIYADNECIMMFHVVPLKRIFGFL